MDKDVRVALAEIGLTAANDKVEVVQLFLKLDARVGELSKVLLSIAEGRASDTGTILDLEKRVSALESRRTA